MARYKIEYVLDTDAPPVALEAQYRDMLDATHEIVDSEGKPYDAFMSNLAIKVLP